MLHLQHYNIPLEQNIVQMLEYIKLSVVVEAVVHAQSFPNSAHHNFMSRVKKANYVYRRTIDFLSSGRIHLKNNVRVLHIKYTTHGDSSAGTRLQSKW